MEASDTCTDSVDQNQRVQNVQFNSRSTLPDISLSSSGEKGQIYFSAVNLYLQVCY